MILRLLISLILAYLTVMMAVPYLRRFALNLNWLDVANSERKVHTDSVPLVGGVVMAFGIVAALLLNYPGSVFVSGLSRTLLIGGGLLLITGMIDDKVDLSPVIKLSIQCCCAYFLCVRGVYLDGVFDLFYLGALPLLVKQGLTLLLIVGIVNAYNLIDGIDGLAGSLFAVGFAWTGTVALASGHTDIVLLSGVSLAAVLAFLRFNLSAEQKIFMGDGGSLFLGFLLAGLNIATMERGVLLEFSGPVVIGCCSVLALPVLDELRVFAGRMAAGRSPLYADNTHIHHILLQIDPAHRVVRHWILLISAAVFFAGVATSQVVGVWPATGVVLLILAGIFTVLRIQQDMHRHRRELRTLEKRNPAAGPRNLS